jgi:hypothetical protein
MPKLGFHPKAHGWHFTNTFVNHVLPGTPFHFETSGLCGGMVMSALDYWRSGTAIPTHTAGDFGADGVPADGSTLRTYIFDRQMNSLLTGMTVTRWVVMPWFGPESFHEWAVGSEFEVVKRQIDRERPAMLGLWAMPDQGMGHQVLCYGYESAPLRLWVYDPNYPDTEMMLVPVSPEVGCQICVAETDEPRSAYRGYFWTDVYNWNEPPYQPRYHDLEVASGLTLSPGGDNVPVGGRVNAAATVRNGGEYPARFKNLFVWTRGPDGSNLDHLLGGAEPDLTVLHPGEERLLSRQAGRFGEQPGAYVVGISYLSNQDDWLPVTAGPGATTQQQVVLRALTQMVVDQTVEVRESDTDVDTHIDIAPGMEYALSASGSIWAGVWFTGVNGPAGWTDRIETNPRSPLTNSPHAHPFSLVGRFDGSTYFYVGDGVARHPYEDAISRRLFLRINDDTPGNGTGSFRCRVQAWR